MRKQNKQKCPLKLHKRSVVAVLNIFFVIVPLTILFPTDLVVRVHQAISWKGRSWNRGQYFQRYFQHVNTFSIRGYFYSKALKRIQVVSSIYTIFHHCIMSICVECTKRNCYNIPIRGHHSCFLICSLIRVNNLKKNRRGADRMTIWKLK